MFDLMAPMFLAVGGAIGVLVPMILHLIQSKRTVRMPFSTIRFLRLSQKKSSRRIRMENWLLWLLRTALLVLLALAFAMPMLREKLVGNWLGKAPRDVAIVIDSSYSMNYNLGRRTVWEDAVAAAEAIIEGLGEKDQFCLFIAREHVEPVIEQLTADREEGLTRVRALACAQGTSKLAPAVMAAYAVLSEGERGHEREIHIITDTQALPWEDFGGGEKSAKKDKSNLRASAERALAEGIWDPDAIDKRTMFYVTALGAASPENVAPISVGLKPSLLVADSPARATVRFIRTGPPNETTAALYMDDEKIVERAISLDSSGGAQISFPMPPLKSGRHSGYIEMPEDNLAIDNRFYFTVEARDRLSVLCVGDPEAAFFLRAALSVGLEGRPALDIKYISSAGISGQNLSPFSCIFLCDALPLPGSDIAAIERFVAAGGVLAVLPGNKATLVDYQSWRCLPAPPTRVVNVPVMARGKTLHWEKREHPVLSGLSQTTDSIRVAVKRALTWDGIKPPAEALITSGNDEWFLIGRPYERGYTLLFAVSADRSWSDFPLSPYYLPLMHQVVRSAAGFGGSEHFIWCTENLPLAKYLREVLNDLVLTGPDGERVPVRTAVVEGETVMHAEGLNKAGIYMMTDASTLSPEPALAVNMPRVESNLTPITDEEIPERLGVEHIALAHDPEGLLENIRERRIGKTFGEHLMWLVLILAVTEFFYASYLLKKAPTLTDVLKMDSSGRLPAHHEDLSE